jgi:putative tryptophan/tyrosine transport system substrate-binding protein
MRRREFIGVLGGAAAWPLAARGQVAAVPLIAFLYPYPITGAQVRPYFAAFLEGLAENGFIEGKNVAIEWRDAGGRLDRLPGLAADLLQLRPTVIVAGQLPAALAVKAATTTVPIVFTASDDPVKTGLVTSINRPGGNATGVNPMVTSIAGKRLGLLHELIPGASILAVLFNPSAPDAASQLSDIQAAAQTLGMQILVANASAVEDFDTAFETFHQQQSPALLMAPDPLLSVNVNRLITLSARYEIPAMYSLRADAVAGGLMSYGPSLTDSYRQLGTYTARVLKGEKPGDIPIWQTVKFELVINLKTAHALGLTIPPTLLARADEVIE